MTEISTNTGTGIIDQEANVPGFREVMFSEDAIANLFALNELCQKYRVVFDSEKENAFIVHLSKDRKIKFPVNSQGLYTYNPLEDQQNNEVVNNISTRTRSKSKKVHVKGYTPREVKRAKAARRLYHSLTAQEIGELKTFIRGNMMRNNPVTTHDVNLAEGLFGKDMPTIKGKSTNKKGEVIKDEQIELPEEL